MGSAKLVTDSIVFLDVRWVGRWRIGCPKPGGLNPNPDHEFFNFTVDFKRRLLVLEE